MKRICFLVSCGKGYTVEINKFKEQSFLELKALRNAIQKSGEFNDIKKENKSTETDLDYKTNNSCR